MAISIGSMDFRPIFLNRDLQRSLIFFKKGYIMEQTRIPDAKEMVVKSDALGVEHLQPALNYIGGIFAHIGDYDLVDRMINIDAKGLYDAYNGSKYVLNDKQLIKYLEDELGYEVSAGYEYNLRLYGITLKW